MDLGSFLKYNNTVPIVLSLLLVSAGGAYAATNPDAVFSERQQVTSVDNTYIVNKDLSTYTPTVQIQGVTEDADSYVVDYAVSTIDIDNYVWKDIVRQERMVVAKAELHGGDLGLYVTRQLRNVIDNQLSYLHTVQDNERKHVSQAVVSTTYGGLIGKFLNDKTETLPGYVPAIAPQPEPVAETQSVASVAASTQGSTEPASSQGSTAAPEPSTTSLTIQILGNNPANVPLHASYADLGAVVLDPRSPNLGYYTYQNGTQVETPIIDTSEPATYVIEYRATDSAGVVVTAQRTVLVAGGAPAPQGAATSTPQ